MQKKAIYSIVTTISLVILLVVLTGCSRSQPQAENGQMRVNPAIVGPVTTQQIAEQAIDPMAGAYDGIAHAQTLPVISAATRPTTSMATNESTSLDPNSLFMLGLIYVATWFFIALAIYLKTRKKVAGTRAAPAGTQPLTSGQLAVAGLALAAISAVLLPFILHPARQRADLAQLLTQAQVTLPKRLPPAAEAKVALGEALFWDPLLGGNKDIACVTCHHPLLGTGDSLSLPIGTGGQGMGTERFFFDSTRELLVPRNATPVYNLAFEGMDILFWDGRVQAHGAEIISPAGDALPHGLENAIAVQAMFPVTSRAEMRGMVEDPEIFHANNELSQIDDADLTDIWERIMIRLLALPAYQTLFTAAYPDTPLDELSFKDAANAIAAYQMDTFTFLDSPWDRYLQGETSALSEEALAGAILFFGEAGCAQCHNGPLLSDLQFYNIGVPQIGPGKGDESPYDYGRARETDDEADKFAFRTPPLRNVELTGPWMHNGAYPTLDAAVRHHLDPALAVANYDFEQLSPLMQHEDSGDPAVHTAALNASSFTRPTGPLSDREIASIVSFLHALTSPSARDLSHTIPDSVPSDLPVGGALK